VGYHIQNSLICAWYYLKLVSNELRRGKKGETDDEDDNEDAEKKKLRKGLEGSPLYILGLFLCR
jgi:hypothetical protein